MTVIYINRTIRCPHVDEMRFGKYRQLMRVIIMYEFTDLTCPSKPTEVGLVVEVIFIMSKLKSTKQRMEAT
jgi:hypothetical protein